MPLIDFYRILLSVYGNQGWWPLIKNSKCKYNAASRLDSNSDEKIEISIGAILTQNTSWDNVVLSLIKLKSAGLLNYKSLNNTDDKNIELYIHSSGYFHQKTRKIRLFIEFIKKTLNGDIKFLSDYSLSDARSLLLGIWGIGQETADSILLYAFGYRIFVVDAYTKRLFERLGLICEENSYKEIQALFMAEAGLGMQEYREYHALIVKHAKEFCRKKPDCERCCFNRPGYCSGAKNPAPERT